MQQSSRLSPQRRCTATKKHLASSVQSCHVEWILEAFSLGICALIVTSLWRKFVSTNRKIVNSLCWVVCPSENQPHAAIFVEFCTENFPQRLTTLHWIFSLWRSNLPCFSKALTHSGPRTPYGGVISCSDCFTPSYDVLRWSRSSHQCHHMARKKYGFSSPVPPYGVNERGLFYWLFVHWLWRHYDQNLLQPIEKFLTVCAE